MTGIAHQRPGNPVRRLSAVLLPPALVPTALLGAALLAGCAAQPTGVAGTPAPVPYGPYPYPYGSLPADWISDGDGWKSSTGMTSFHGMHYFSKGDSLGPPPPGAVCVWNCNGVPGPANPGIPIRAAGT